MTDVGVLAAVPRQLLGMQGRQPCADRAGGAAGTNPDC